MRAIRGFVADRAPGERWTLRRRVAILLFVILAGLLAIGTVSVTTTLVARRAIGHELASIAPAARDSGALSTAIANQHAYQLAYAAGRDPVALRSYTAEGSHAARLFAKLEHDLVDHPTELSELAGLQSAYQIWLTTVAEPSIAGAPPGGAAPAQAADPQAVYNQVDQLAAGLVSDVNGRAIAVEQDVVNNLLSSITLSITRSAFVIAMLVLLWLLLARLAFHPIDRLNREVQAVADGELDRPIGGQGPKELAALGANTEAMRRRLRDESDELRQLRQALTQRSPLHGLIRSELESSKLELDLAIAGRLVPANGVLAGDWYDAWDIGDRKIAFALVDVSGHGPESGLLALKVKHLMAPSFRSGLAPGDALSWVTEQLSELEEQCATAIVADLDTSSGRFRYANAGHPSGLLFRHDRVDALARTGPLVSSLGGAWETRELEVSNGDLLVLVTDGITEARLPDGSDFGLERLIELIERRHRAATPELVAESIVGEVRKVCDMPLRDDATVVVVGFTWEARPVVSAGP